MYPYDGESRKRVKRHRKMRAGKGFETVECYTGLSGVHVPEGSTVLLECMSNLVANEMFREEGAREKTYDEITKGILHLKEQAAHLIVVTNEIFSEAMCYQGDTEEYRRCLGNINQFLAGQSDLAAEVVYGIPVYFKKNAEIPKITGEEKTDGGKL